MGKERTALELILAGGTFTNDRWSRWAAKRGQTVSPKCPCGAPSQTEQHIWWECELWRTIRSSAGVELLDETTRAVGLFPLYTH
eukprot:1783593-Amphidinium_carterae.1